MSDWTFNGVARMLEMISSQSLTALFQVVMIDLVLAGDNAIVIGLAAAGLPKSQRNKAILIGIFAATILRIGFASITVQLLQIIGLLLAGGILLLWVCWKMWRELRVASSTDISESVVRKHDGCDRNSRPPKDAWSGRLADHAR
jgi:predicted tellurium resistance membrane protein TerC